MERDDNDVAMADESGAETIHYDDEDAALQNKEGIFESAQGSSDGAWGMVARASRRKGKGKMGHACAAAENGAKGRPARADPSPAPPTPKDPPRVQHDGLEEEGEASSRQDSGVLDLIKALREDARMREEEANRRHQEQLEWMRRLETTSGSHTTNLAQLHVQTAALNLMLDDLNNRMMTLERITGSQQTVAAAATPVVHPLEATDVAVPAGDAEMADAPTRGRKGMREDSSERGEEDGRPSKRHAQEDFESAAEADASHI